MHCPVPSYTSCECHWFVWGLEKPLSKVEIISSGLHSFVDESLIWGCASSGGGNRDSSGGRPGRSAQAVAALLVVAAVHVAMRPLSAVAAACHTLPGLNIHVLWPRGFASRLVHWFRALTVHTAAHSATSVATSCLCCQYTINPTFRLRPFTAALRYRTSAAGW